MKLRAHLPLAALCAVAVIAGCWPYLEVLDHWPWALDDAVWVQSGAERGLAWAFGEAHFIAWRPIAALSYLANYWVVGFEPALYRATDLALFACAIVAVGVGARSLLRDRGGWWAGGVALLFAMHPVGHEIAPYLARRSYSMCLIFGMLGLALFDRALERGSWRSAHALGAAGLLTLAVLTNETAYVLIPVALLWSIRRAVGWRQGLLALLPTLLGAVVALVGRFIVLGVRPGGYRHNLVAGTWDGKKIGARWVDLEWYEIAWRSVDYVLVPVSPSGVDPTYLVGAGWALGIIGLLLVAAVLHKVVVDRDLRSAMEPVILLTWAAGYVLLYGITHTWFWRQGYPIVVPLSLLFVWLARWLVELPGWRRWLAAPGVSMLLVMLLPWASNSRAWRGLDGSVVLDVSVGSEVVDGVRPLLEQVGEGDHVWLAASLGEPGALRASDWLTLLSAAEVQPLTCTGRLLHPAVIDVGERRFRTGGGVKFCPGARRSLDLPLGDEHELPLGRLVLSERNWLAYRGPDGWVVRAVP